jgi:hypothetical protein
MINRILVSALLAATVLSVAPLDAQQGRPRPGRSDRSGVIVTGSGIAGYPVIPVRDLEDALFRRMGAGRTAFRTAPVADAVLAEAAEAQREACAGTLQRPEAWPDGLPLDTVPQRVVCGLLAKSGMDTEEARLVLCALRGGQPGADGDAAWMLVAALAGLGGDRPAFVDQRQRYIDGARWENALRAYQLYLATAPDAVMDPPSAEMVSIAVILDRVVDAGLAASGR